MTQKIYVGPKSRDLQISGLLVASSMKYALDITSFSIYHLRMRSVTLGAYLAATTPTCLALSLITNDGYPDPNEKSKVTEESTKERISQFVVEIEVEPRANSEGAIIETRGLEEARNVGSKPLLEAPVIECDPVLILCFGNGPKFAPKQKSGKWRNLHQRSRPRKQAIF